MNSFLKNNNTGFCEPGNFSNSNLGVVLMHLSIVIAVMMLMILTLDAEFDCAGFVADCHFLK